MVTAEEEDGKKSVTAEQLSSDTRGDVTNDDLSDPEGAVAVVAVVNDIVDELFGVA